MCMKQLIVIWTLSLLSVVTIAQTSNYSTADIYDFFEQVKVKTERHKLLWDKDIYAPILLVDPITREAFANQQDEEGELKLLNKIYVGKLPKSVPVSNTDITWNGTHWAMLMLPLPSNILDKLDLTTHELFHRAQPSLGFKIRREENNHLDQKDGRFYLRLELAALEAALKATRLNKSEEHLRNALIFRKYRHILYRGSQVTENSLEMLEGIATYTGQIMSGRDKWQWREYLIKRIQKFEESPSFIRSFAYETIPVYGFFLHQKDYYWNKKIDNETDLTDFFSEAFELDTRILLQTYVRQVADEYDLKRITDEELARLSTHSLTLDEYRTRFLYEPHLEIRLENMNMSFNPSSLIPLDEDEGTVYPTIVLTDNWGILTVTEGGALLRTDWRWVIVSVPTEITENIIKGDGWVIELNKGYVIEENEEGDFLLTKIKR